MGSAGSRNRSKHEHGRPRLCKVARVCVQLPCERFRGCFNAFELDEPSDSGEASKRVAVPVHPRRALFWGRERGGGRSRSCNWSAVHSKLVRGAHLEREQQSHSHSLNEPLSSTAQRLLFSPPQTLVRLGRTTSFVGQPHCPILRGISTRSRSCCARTSLESTQIVPERYQPQRPVIRATERLVLPADPHANH